MGLFNNLFKKQQINQNSCPDTATTTLSREEKYGKAWRMLVSQERQQGLQIWKELDVAGFVEGSIALAMFTENQTERMRLVKKAADANNPEGLWEYCGFLPHSYRLNPNNAQDALWEQYCTKAAELGSVDAMNEMGNIYHRRGNYAESMYWYAMANAHDHRDGTISMRGIAREWANAGAPYEFQRGSEKFDQSRHKCAIAYLELNANKKLSVDLNEIIPMVLAGVPIAAYLAGDLFEGLENDEMAYRMYNAIAFENDAHGLKCYADMLFAGKGVQRDVNSAVRMYNMAANLGERSAMFIMGEFTKAQNKNLAAYWYGVSHTRGYENSLSRLMQLG